MMRRQPIITPPCLTMLDIMAYYFQLHAIVIVNLLLFNTENVPGLEYRLIE